MVLTKINRTSRMIGGVWSESNDASYISSAADMTGCRQINYTLDALSILGEPEARCDWLCPQRTHGSGDFEDHLNDESFYRECRKATRYLVRISLRIEVSSYKNRISQKSRTDEMFYLGIFGPSVEIFSKLDRIMSSRFQMCVYVRLK